MSSFFSVVLFASDVKYNYFCPLWVVVSYSALRTQ